MDKLSEMLGKSSDVSLDFVDTNSSLINLRPNLDSNLLKVQA